MKFQWLSKVLYAIMIVVLAVAALPVKPAYAQIQSYTTAGTSTWQAPAGVTSVTVQVWGGGGRGGSFGGGGGEAAGGGGGGGAYSSSTITVTPLTNYTVIVGAGSTTPAAGQQSSFNIGATILVMAVGGNSSNNINGATGGFGNSGVGTTRLSGGNGANGSTAANYGGGGGSSAGTALVGVNATNATGATAPAGGGNGGNGAAATGAGTIGTAPGGGGGGPYRNGGGGGQNGGNGAAGQVILTYNIASPTITSNGGGANAAINVAENTTAVTNVDATDADLPAQTLTYSISGGVDAARFAIDPATGVLTFGVAPNFEVPTDTGANNVYDVIVQVSDGNGGTDTQAIAVTVTAVNDNDPVITSDGGGANAAINVAENTTAVTNVDATDADLPAQTLTYSISGGVDAARFAIDPATGVLTFGVAPNFEVPTDTGANNVYDVIVQASDGTRTDSQAIAVTVTAVNDNDPVITSNGGGANAAVNVAENSTAVTTITATDADLPAQTLTYSISGGVDAARFTIVPATGVLTFAAAPNFEAPSDAGADNVYDVIVQVSDGGRTDSQAIAITVTAVNDNNPVITSNAAVNVAENTTAVIDVNATDADLPAQTLTYSIFGGADAARFTIVPATGVLTFSAAPNFEAPTDTGANNVYDVIVQASDGAGGTVTQAIAVTVTDVVENTPPTITSNGGLANAAVNVTENTTAVTDVDATDTDLPAQTLTYSISGGADAARFTIVPATGVLTFGTAPDFETPTDAGTDNVYDVVVQVSDGAGGIDTQAIAVTVTNTNDAPVITSDGGGATASISVAENTTAVTDVNATDVDLPAQTLTYSVSGGADAASFTIVPATGVLTFGSAPDFEIPTDAGADNVYDVIVQVSDGAGGTVTQAIAVTVTAANDNDPVITSDGGGATANISVVENTTAVTDVDATDADLPAQTLTYSISGGADAARFAIVGGTGVLAFSPAPDFDISTDVGLDNVYDVVVQASDGAGRTDTQAIAVTVTNANEAPVVNAATFSIGENSVNGTAVGTPVTFTDPDTGQAHTFAITAGNTGGAFTINSGTGQITVADSTALDFETTPTFSLTVQVTDNGAPVLSGTNTITVNLSDVNDAPLVAGIPDQTITEGSSFVTINLDDYVSDVDNTDAQMSWASSGNTQLTVSIVARVATISIPAADWNGSETITFTAADPGLLSDDDAAIFTVNSVNNAPFFVMGGNQIVSEDAGARTVSNWATSISAGPADEAGQALNFTVTNDNNPLFSAQPQVAANGTLTFTPAANANGTATVTVESLTDNGGTANGGVDTYTPAPNTFTITVNPVNDAPSFTSTPVTSATQNSVYTYNITVTDPDGDPLTITANTKPAWLTSFTDNGNGTATLSGTPANSNIGSHSVVLRVTDGVVATPVEQSFAIVVGDINDAPTFTSTPVTTAGESTVYTYKVVTTDPDAGDKLTISATSLPTWLTLTPDKGKRTATLKGTPGSSLVGVHHVVLEVTDGKLSDTQAFDITVGNTAPQVTANGIKIGKDVLDENEVVSIGVNKFLVTFNQDVYDPAGDTDPNDVTYPANYMLVNDNGDGFQTLSCAAGVNAQDIAITVDSVTYSNGGGSGPYTATLLINGELPISNGRYRLFICGSTSIVDIVDNTLKLAGDGVTPGTDFNRNFRVTVDNNGDGNGNDREDSGASNFLIPVTGFAPDQVTALPAQPADKAYKPLNEMRIEIPTLGINYPIVGAAVSKNSWDLTWLKDSVAYLEGSAYPTKAGNTVLTAHVADANDNIGPFSDIKGMQLGQRIYIHFNRQVFVYQVQENKRISPTNISAVFKHEEYDWVTLVTCEDYNEAAKSYNYRRMVRAVLISVVPEK